MRFRQVHLDFHTSEAIPGIGSRFDKKQFQNMLKTGYVDSITIFAKCHHGWAYHHTDANQMHPGLTFDLLEAMIEAAHEIDVKTPVYLSAGLDEKLALIHPDWLIRNENDKTSWADSFLKTGYHEFCMNTPYLDVLVAQIEEVVRNYDADGIFLDIVSVRPCLCGHCIRTLLAEGKNPLDSKEVLQLAERTYANYTKRVRDAIDAIKPGLPVFHNGGHIRRGRRDLAVMNSHLELESLPTGGWGYDHFPLSARYVQGLGMDFLGMTGKFHTTWGEFGGFKHPNALRYEAALSIANGAKCSIGDQLHPEGLMDQATYELIGAAYREVASKEEWCLDTRAVADIALFSAEALEAINDGKTGAQSGNADVGAVRMLLEGNYLFDIVDLESNFDAYKVIILPDRIPVFGNLKSKLDAFLEKGGKILASGSSGLDAEGEHFTIDLGIRHIGVSPYKPEYFRPAFELKNIGSSSFINYSEGHLIELDHAHSLGCREYSYFNREPFLFCSHQHTPSSLQDNGPGMTQSDNGIYMAWHVFEDYSTKGSLFLKECIHHALDLLLDVNKTLETTLPAQGIATVMEQPLNNRYVAHLLYASPVKRGTDIEVIEDILPVLNTDVTLRLPKPIKNVYLAPQMDKLPFQCNENEGTEISFTIPKIDCHQMVVMDY